MAALVIIIAIIVALNLFIRWSTRRGEEINDYFSENENSPEVETLLHLNQSRGNHL